MRKICLSFFMAAWIALPLSPQNPAKPLTTAGVPEFLASYQKSLDRVDGTYADLVNEKLPLRDENGQPLGRHHLNDRRNEIEVLRQTIHQLAAKPDDLVLTTRLFIQTEALVDDLFDLSQIAYDNDQEELGKRCTELEVAADRQRASIESYALSLAAEKQKRLEELEKQNRDLEQKAKENTEKPKPKSPATKPPKR